MNIAVFSLIFLLNPGFSFLSVPRSPDPYWRGTGAWASLENPAEASSHQGMSFAQLLWLEDSRVSVLSLTTGSWGFGLSYFDQGAVEYRGEIPDDEFSFTFHPYAAELQIMRVFHVDPELRVGIGGSYFSQTILEKRASGGLLHGGLLYQPVWLSRLRLGFFVRNFGLKAGFDQTPTRLGLYGSYQTDFFGIGFFLGKIWTFPYPESPLCGTGSWWCEQSAAIRRFLKHVFTGPGSYRQLSLDIPLHRGQVFFVVSSGAVVERLRLGFSFPVRKLRLTYAYALTRYGFDGLHYIGVGFDASRF